MEPVQQPLRALLGRQILQRPLPEILDLLEEDSERMIALRQATPFAGVLEPAERWAVYKGFDRGLTSPMPDGPR
jgi:hypothetical protein